MPVRVTVAWAPGALTHTTPLATLCHGAHPHVDIGNGNGHEHTRYHRAIAGRGAYVEFDHIRKGADLDRRVEYVMAMAEAGLLDHVLLSHDLAFRPDLTSHGGAGLTLITEFIVPRLLERGLSQQEIDRILVDNPRRALTGPSRRGARADELPQV